MWVVLCPHNTFLSSCRPQPPPQALHYSDSFDSLISASWRSPGLARQSRCPGTEPAGHSLASADESCEGQEVAFLGELGQLASFRAPGGIPSPKKTKKWLTQCLQESGILLSKTPAPTLPYSFSSHLHPRGMPDAGCGRWFSVASVSAEC